MRLIDVDAIKLEKGFFENIDNVPKFFEWLGKQPTINPVKWIPTTESLPIPNSVYESVSVYYLVQNEYGDMMVATFIQFPGGARVWQQMYQDGAIMEDIVAWMPLPEPWKGGEDETLER